MSRRRPSGLNRPMSAQAGEWGRGKLLAVLITAAVVVSLLAVGLVVALDTTLRPRPPAPQGAPPAVPSPSERGPVQPGDEEQTHRDSLAATPMRSVPLSAALPQAVSVRAPGVIILPRPTRIGPVGVLTGYPHTPQGALAQLAALDKAAMQPANLGAARAVIAAWAAPGGPTPESWSGVKAMADFLTALGMSGGGSPDLALVVTPLMGLVKGTVGPDFVVACVDFEFDATVQMTLRVAVADCQRMVWQGDRWVVGPGEEPARAPSVWPDTDTAIDAGYLDLRVEGAGR